MGVGNARRGHQNGHSVTYWMNRLQGLDDDKPLFVSIRSRSISAIAMTAIWL
jgi:predicted NAD/FAD-binding protein